MSSNPTKSEATNAEATKNTKQGSDWLGGPQNGNEAPGESYFIPKHRNETPGESYGSGSASGFLPETTKNPKEGSDWLGGPQNGNETPGESSGRVGTGNIESDYTKHR